MIRPAISSATPTEDALVIAWQDGHSRAFPYVWLRDNAPENRHASGQRLIDPVDVPLDSAPAAVALGETLDITWADDGHTSRFDPAWLRAHADAPGEEQRHPAPALWAAADIARRLPRHDYTPLRTQGSALRDMLRDVRDLGFAVLHGAPTAPGVVLDVVRLFGHVRDTSFGAVFDLLVKPDPTSLGYTNRGLPGHTDNPYRQPPPTVQLLHCLKNDVSGGESTLADGFNVAEQLRREDPHAFALLATTPLTFAYRDEGADLQRESPVIQTDSQGRVAAVYFNSRSVQPFRVAPEGMRTYYAAYQRFGRLAEDAANRITLRLAPGDVLVLDNRRILHGRAPFGHDGERHVQGCYADVDGLLSTLAILSRGPARS